MGTEEKEGIHTHVLPDGAVISHAHSHEHGHGHTHSHAHTKAVLNRLSRAIRQMQEFVENKSGNRSFQYSFFVFLF